MDPFDTDRPELSGNLITMHFGQGGRIVELWTSDPALPDESEDFQFVLPPLTFGEETSEDLLPGTILIGARTDPNNPWILSRNQNAQQMMDFEAEDIFRETLTNIQFEYDFPLLPEIHAIGKFSEQAGPLNQIIWDLEIRNRGRATVEIGELGFPFAFNNFYDGFGWTDDQLKKLWNSRVYIHKYIGGAASWVFVQRMTSEPPGLLIVPGDNTGWEFCSHIPSSINTPFQWEGIPVVYAHSRATVEREGWKNWSNEHTSLILEPGDSRKFQIKFISAERDKEDTVAQTLVAVNRPAIRLFPGACAPVDVGIGIEVAGASPKSFYASRDVFIESDIDDEGGFCFVRPKTAGPLRVSFEDKEGRMSHVHLMFTDSIETLIKRRAEYIVKNQIELAPGSQFEHAILLTNTVKGERVTSTDEYSGASGIECSLADAVYLAEKNSIYPKDEEIAALDHYIKHFIQDDIQNPADMSVGCVLAPGSTATYTGRPLIYPDVFNLYHAMFRVAKAYGHTALASHEYLRFSARTALAMFQFGWRHYVRTVGILGYARIYQILEDLKSEGLTEELEALEPLVRAKAEEMVKQQYPYAGESVMDTSGYEEVFHAALYLNNDEHLERTMRCAYAARSLAPSWWWYGSDKRSWDGADSTPLKALIDRGEACLAHTTIPNSALFFAWLDRDYATVPDAYMRLAFGGMLGPWALVRNDGAVSMCFCPDPSSKHHGYNMFTGSAGLGLFHYLRLAGSFVLPNQALGLFTFGCHFEQTDDRYTIRPWDGIGRRVVLRQFNAEFRLEFGKIVSVELDLRKRWAEITVENVVDSEIETNLLVKGLWGSKLTANGTPIEAEVGKATILISLKPLEKVIYRIEVVE